MTSPSGSLPVAAHCCWPGLLLLPFVLGGSLYLSGWKPDPAPAIGASSCTSRREGPTPGSRRRQMGVDPGSRANCDARCASRLDALRRIQVSLNKGHGSLRRVVMAADLANPGSPRPKPPNPTSSSPAAMPPGPPPGVCSRRSRRPSGAALWPRHRAQGTSGPTSIGS